MPKPVPRLPRQKEEEAIALFLKTRGATKIPQRQEGEISNFWLNNVFGQRAAKGKKRDFVGTGRDTRRINVKNMEKQK